MSPSPLALAGFDELALFVDVAESGSITAAARRLGLPKSTVSRALSRLEAKLGVALLRRTNRGHALTEQGIELALTVAPHVTALRDAVHALGRTRDEAYGTLRVTAPIDLGEQLLGPLLPGFLALHPRLRVEVEISQRFVDVIGEGLDVSLRVSSKPLPTSSLRGRRIAALELGLYAAPSYLAKVKRLQRPEDLTRCEHVLFRGTRGQTQLSLSGPEGGVEVPVFGRLGGDDFYFVRAAVVAGAGVGSMPAFLARDEVSAKRLVRVLPRYALKGATLHLLHAPAKPLPRKVEVLRDYLLEHAPRLLKCS